MNGHHTQGYVWYKCSYLCIVISDTWICHVQAVILMNGHIIHKDMSGISVHIYVQSYRTLGYVMYRLSYL